MLSRGLVNLEERSEKQQSSSRIIQYNSSLVVFFFLFMVWFLPSCWLLNRAESKHILTNRLRTRRSRIQIMLLLLVVWRRHFLQHDSHLTKFKQQSCRQYSCYRFRLESICREIFCSRIYFNALTTASQISIDHRSCFSST